jgi:hypothetical protein
VKVGIDLDGQRSQWICSARNTRGCRDSPLQANHSRCRRKPIRAGQVALFRKQGLCAAAHIFMSNSATAADVETGLAKRRPMERKLRRIAFGLGGFAAASFGPAKRAAIT